MNLRQELLKENSRKQRMFIAGYIGHDPEKFKELMVLFTGNEKRVVQLAAAVADECIMAHHSLAAPYWPDYIRLLHQPLHDAVSRNILRFMQFITIPEPYQAEVLELCFGFMMSEKEPVAVRAFAMTVAYRIACEQPDLKNEVQMVIEDMLHQGSAGIRARGNKLLKKLAAKA